MRARGLDLSAVQGHVDFHAIAGAGYAWVTLKATEGNRYVDPTFESNARAAKGAGLMVDAYHFLGSQSPIAEQVAHFSEVVGELVDLPPSVDFESPEPSTWKPGQGSELSKRALEAVQIMEQRFGAGRVSLYSYPHFVKSLTSSPELLELVKRDLWIASYRDEKNEPAADAQPYVPAPWTAWKFWQWSGDKGSAAPGVQCVVDHNVFNGTVEELRQLSNAPIVTDDCRPVFAMPDLDLLK